jgi:hypothetical protein
MDPGKIQTFLHHWPYSMNNFDNCWELVVHSSLNIYYCMDFLTCPKIDTQVQGTTVFMSPQTCGTCQKPWFYSSKSMPVPEFYYPRLLGCLACKTAMPITLPWWLIVRLYWLPHPLLLLVPNLLNKVKRKKPFNRTIYMVHHRAWSGWEYLYSHGTGCQSVAGSFPVSPSTHSHLGGVRKVRWMDFPKLQSEQSLPGFELTTLQSGVPTPCH